MNQSRPLTASTPIAEWLAHPTGGPLVRGLLIQAGAGEELLAPIVGLPLQQLVVMSQGQLPQVVVDDLVLQVNDGVMPDVEGEAAGWAEQVTPGRFKGKTVIVSGAASGIGRAVASRVAREGGTVVSVDVSSGRLDALAADHPQTRIVTVTGDITEQASLAPPAGSSTHSPTSHASTTTSPRCTKPPTRRGTKLSAST